ncbi:CBS domain-containing protein [Candidatus Chloroploca sp. M-50]|uniref:CBS domain-containing protein n=1 Tax=Candidatus Chloroploca mongolica TaxID=2528176 RepID=A0ABS4DFD4_9CHLR|nr:CBS domain-containing protein [Candidatus Chloroploca mongolica]MBP1468146.1 CBS domain-containing protein [Candidatus Chloroploca mongolica]
MESTKTVRQLLKVRRGPVWTTSPDASVSDAVHLMTTKDVGALMVLDGERVAGIITERDVARKVVAAGRLEGLRVGDLMTERVLYVRPEQPLAECMALMSERQVRHLPVLEHGQLVGIISIRDVVADIVAEQSFLIEQLEQYIYELPPHQRT